jgi:hypothetical protein
MLREAPFGEALELLKRSLYPKPSSLKDPILRDNPSIAIFSFGTLAAVFFFRGAYS